MSVVCAGRKAAWLQYNKFSAARLPVVARALVIIPASLQPQCFTWAFMGKGSKVYKCTGNLLTRCFTLQYIDMDDPKAALAKTLNQTALTQDGARAAMEGISPVLTQGVRPPVAMHIDAKFF